MLKIARALGHDRIRAGHFADNPASGKVLRKLGFVATGTSARRFSLARQGLAESIEYALDLEPEMAGPAFARAA